MTTVGIVTGGTPAASPWMRVFARWTISMQVAKGAVTALSDDTRQTGRLQLFTNSA